jgi:hypothetical protein
MLPEFIPSSSGGLGTIGSIGDDAQQRSTQVLFVGRLRGLYDQQAAPQNVNQVLRWLGRQSLHSKLRLPQRLMSNHSIHISYASTRIQLGGVHDRPP